MMKRAVILALVLLLCLSGCTPARTAEDRITDALTVLYTCPDDYHKEHAAQLDSANFDETAAVREAWIQHNQERFRAEDFADGLLDQLVTGWTQNVEFLETFALNQGAELSPKSIDVERSAQSDDLYHFTAVISVEQKDGNTQEGAVTGSARVGGDGRIAEFRLLDTREVTLLLSPPYQEP